MITNLFYTFFYNPIYNALVALVAVVPGSDVGIAVIMVTIMIRLLILPLSLSVARTQRAMKTLEPKLKELKEKHKGNREKEATETFALYKDARINPFMSILMTLIQIPIFLALYFVFFYEPLTTINTVRLYALTPIPMTVSFEFLGILSIVKGGIILAALAGITQFIQAHFSLLNLNINTSNTNNKIESKSAQTNSVQTSVVFNVGDFQKIMSMQLKYVLPFIIAIVSYTTSGAIALYFITANIIGALQELYIRRTL